MLHARIHTHDLRSRLRRCLEWATRLEGEFYRAVTAKYANCRDLLSGVGSWKFGGRWNPPMEFAAVYGCLRPATAMAEALENFEEYGIPAAAGMPLVIVAVSVRLQAVLDLSRPDVEHALGLPRRRMMMPWRPRQGRGEEVETQALGRLAWEEGVEALIVPSARVEGEKNLVVFPDRRRPDSSWTIHGAGDLPR